MSETRHSQKSSFGGLVLGALGIVYGDIGTSPLYTLHECFAGEHPLAVDRDNILGILSLIVWALTIIVSEQVLSFTLEIADRFLVIDKGRFVYEDMRANVDAATISRYLSV